MTEPQPEKIIATQKAVVRVWVNEDGEVVEETDVEAWREEERKRRRRRFREASLSDDASL
jgi:hypothetical protein